VKTVRNTPPNLIGTHGQAWVPDNETIARKHPDRPSIDLRTGTWIVHIPSANPHWSYYMISCISLRDVPGIPSAIRYLDNATHEIVVAAINPGSPPPLDDVIQCLYPINFVGQFIAKDDEAARLQIEVSIKEIINGILSPDTDFVSQWVERYGDHCLYKQP
jgi:hypothetical protein